MPDSWWSMMAISPRPEPLVFALVASGSEQFLIIEGNDPAHRLTDTPQVQGPMREEQLRQVLTDRFGMALEAVSRSVEQARQQLRGRATEAPFVISSGPHTPSEGAFVERRNHASRAARVQHLLDVLASTTEGIQLTEAPDELTPAAVERILKPLAVRGLVKVTAGRWAPREVLKAGVNLPLIPD